jgi:hypothetical protein
MQIKSECFAILYLIHCNIQHPFKISIYYNIMVRILILTLLVLTAFADAPDDRV